MSMNKPVIIYGAGFQGEINFSIAAYQNIPIAAFVDQNAKSKVRYFGCDVYTPEDALKKFCELPWIISINDETVNENIKKYLSENNIEAYKSFKDYYTGTLDASINTITCGDPSFCFQILPDCLNQDSIVYSFGIGRNYSFERILANNYNCKVFAFDPSPEVVHRMKNEQLPNNLKYFDYGLSDMDGKKAFHIPGSGRIGKNYSELFCPWVDTTVINLQVYQLSTLMQKLGHTHIDLLKMDIEGSEFTALPNILQSHLKIKQLCIETHARIFPDSVAKMQWIKELMNQYGFLLISNEPSEQTYIHNTCL